MCDNLSRLDPAGVQEFADSAGIALADVLPTFQWFLADRIRQRSLILPTDSPERVRLIMQFVEKRIVSEIPHRVRPRAKCFFLGKGSDAWVHSCRLLAELDMESERAEWVSESDAQTDPVGWPHRVAGGEHSMWIFTYPKASSDALSLAQALSPHPLRW